MKKGLDNLTLIKRIASEVEKRGGRAYLVGGCVRDELLFLESKDFDVEIHFLSQAECESVLDMFGERVEVGKSFGVYNLKGYDIDIALPRSEKKSGERHRDFDIDVNPFIDLKEGAKRRDFTINALMKDVLTGEVLDFFNGKQDLGNKVIRHICDETFVEDALRVFRAAQFCSRFNFTLAPETENLCKKIDVDYLSKERVYEELVKALLKSAKPSVFFEVLRKVNKLSEFFPELEALINVEQSSVYHKEGDVWTHTMMVLDEAAKVREKAEEKLGFMLSALVHDVGKAVTTVNSNGKISALEHEVKGVSIAEKLLNRVTNDKKIIKYVLNMVLNHMKPNKLAAQGSCIKKTNKMFDLSICPQDLVLLATCDNYGRIEENFVDHTAFLNERLKIFNETMAKDFVMGRDLVAAGLKPGKDFSFYLEYAHKLRLAGVDKESALKQTLKAKK